VVQIIENIDIKPFWTFFCANYFNYNWMRGAQKNIFLFKYKISFFCVGLNKKLFLRFTKLKLNGYLQ
jgi:hypothetical protein